MPTIVQMNQAFTCVPASMAWPSAELGRFSMALLQLYDAARSCTVSAFQDRAMCLLSEMVPFDSSWWGRLTHGGVAYQAHCSHLLNLPADVPALLNLTDHDNVVAQGITTDAGRALSFGARDLFARPSTAALTSHMRVMQVLGVAMLEPGKRSGTFLSVARRKETHSFSDREREWLQLWMPHFTSALQLCCMNHMALLRSMSSSTGCLMVASDELGLIHATEPGLVALLQGEWPDWHGPRLPAELLGSLRSTQTSAQAHYDGRSLHAEASWSGQHLLLALRPRLPQDHLTPQERAVALAFSAGHSYKVVARELTMAPATVRHHLRAVYAKFGVSDKAALVRHLGVRPNWPTA